MQFNNNESLKDKGINLRKPLVIDPEMNLLDLMKEFRKGKSHMAFITEDVELVQQKLGLNRSNSIMPAKELMKFNLDMIKKKNAKILGTITLEDVIEEMINIEILDEDDYDKKKKKEKSQWFAKGKFYYNFKGKISHMFTKNFIKENQDIQKLIIGTKARMSIKNSIFMNVDETPLLEK